MGRDRTDNLVSTEINYHASNTHGDRINNDAVLDGIKEGGYVTYILSFVMKIRTIDRNDR